MTKFKTTQLLDIYLDRFANRLDVYCVQRVYWDHNTQRDVFMYRPAWKSPSRDLLLAHLNGKITIGWPSLSLDGYSKWLCFDSDCSDGALDKLQAVLEQYGWHCVREGKRYDYEKRIAKDGHLWLFFDKPVLASQLRILSKAMMESAGVNIEEVFPKQDKPKKIGNVVRGPLGVHRKPGADNCRGWFEGPPKDIRSQLEWLAQQPVNSADTARQLALAHRPIPRPLFIRHSAYSNNIDFVDHARNNGFEQRGDELIGPCPACQLEGHDSDDNHLSINTNTGLVHCWRNCQFIDIVKTIKGTA